MILSLDLRDTPLSNNKKKNLIAPYINAQYLETFKNKVAVVEHYGGLIGNDPGFSKEELVASDTDNPMSAYTPREFNIARARYTGISII